MTHETNVAKIDNIGKHVQRRLIIPSFAEFDY